MAAKNEALLSSGPLQSADLQSTLAGRFCGHREDAGDRAEDQHERKCGFERAQHALSYSKGRATPDRPDCVKSRRSNHAGCSSSRDLRHLSAYWTGAAATAVGAVGGAITVTTTSR